MPARVEVSITMSTCSRVHALEQALATLLPQAEAAPFRTEFVIVDDGSTDATPAALLNFQQRAKVPVTIVRGDSKGIAAARNLAVANCSGIYIAFCDDDQLASPNWLQDLYRAATEHSADFVGGSMHLHLPAPFQLQDYGPRARRLLGEAGLSGAAGPFAADRLPATNNVMMRADAVRRLGGFNIEFTQGGEDTDLFTRARHAGFTLWFEPGARMQHMLTERRLTRAGLRWTAMRIGSSDTHMAHLRDRDLGALKRAASRLLVLFGRDLPKLLIARLRHRAAEALDVQCSIWYTEGVLRSLPTLLRPSSRRSQAFADSMNFRQRNGERTA